MAPGPQACSERMLCWATLAMLTLAGSVALSTCTTRGCSGQLADSGRGKGSTRGKPHQREGAVRQGHPCFCFSVCTEEHALSFLARMPPTLDRLSTHSAWHAYLHAVYGSPVTLPFALRRLSFFYSTISHRGGRAPSSVSLPMAKCELALNRTARSEVWRVAPGQRQCAPAECDRWLLPERPPATMLPAKESLHALRAWCADAWGLSEGSLPILVIHRSSKHVNIIVQLARTALPSTAASTASTAVRGTVAEHGPGQTNETVYTHTTCQSVGSLSTCQQRPRAPAEHDSWVEVFRRKMSFAEGMDAYGCWFYPTSGSGIWVNTGRTVVLEAVGGSTPSALDDALPASTLFADFLREHNASDAVVPPTRGGKRRGERFPSIAHALAFTSVQVLQRGTEQGWAYPELVMTTAPCSSSRRPLGTCPPVAMMTGARHELPCGCSESLNHLNCEAGETSIPPPAGSQAPQPQPQAQP